MTLNLINIFVLLTLKVIETQTKVYENVLGQKCCLSLESYFIFQEQLFYKKLNFFNFVDYSLKAETLRKCLNQTISEQEVAHLQCMKTWQIVVVFVHIQSIRFLAFELH